MTGRPIGRRGLAAAAARARPDDRTPLAGAGGARASAPHPRRLPCGEARSSAGAGPVAATPPDARPPEKWPACFGSEEARWREAIRARNIRVQ